MAKARKRQVAALPFRRVDGRLEVLLVTSRETKRWVIPKGWPMDHYADYNAARQEAFEEGGIAGRMTRKSLGRYEYEKRASGGSARPISVDVYACAVKALLRDWPERHERQRHWFPAKEAAELVHEKGLRKLILKLAKR